jgi:hypothetical protein
MNTRGEVIGLSTLKLVKKNVTGIGFALSSNDLLTVLRRFYPSLGPSAITTSTDSPSEPSPTELSTATDSSVALPSSAQVSEGFGVVTISSEPDAAEIYVDGKFLGNTPATLKLSAGPHEIVLKSAGLPDYSRTLDIPRSSKLNLKAHFAAPPAS